MSEIHELANSVWNKEELPNQLKQSVITPIYKKDDESGCSNYCGIINFMQHFVEYPLKDNSTHTYMKLVGIISVGFNIADQPIRFSAFLRYWRKKWQYSEIVHKLFIDSTIAYDSVKKEVLYNIRIEVVVPMKLVRLIHMF
jgi:hypothetical protein